jgi:excisionase family DNA binding protein
MVKIEIQEAAYYDVPELVKMLGVHRKTIYAWVQQGRLKPYKLGRKYLVSGKDLKRFIESGQG